MLSKFWLRKVSNPYLFIVLFGSLIIIFFFITTHKKHFQNQKEITKDQLQSVIAPPGTSAPTAAANLRNVRVFWLWAADEGLCEPEVIKKVKTPKNKKKHQNPQTILYTKTNLFGWIC